MSSRKEKNWETIVFRVASPLRAVTSDFCLGSTLNFKELLCACSSLGFKLLRAEACSCLYRWSNKSQRGCAICLCHSKLSRELVLKLRACVCTTCYLPFNGFLNQTHRSWLFLESLPFSLLSLHEVLVTLSARLGSYSYLPAFDFPLVGRIHPWVMFSAHLDSR